jgi:hypothetical protein
MPQDDITSRRVRGDMDSDDSILRAISPDKGCEGQRSCRSLRCRRDLCWNLIGTVSDGMRIRGQAARSIGLSASFWVRLCHPSTLRMVI